MTRSIHTTRRRVTAAQRTRLADPAEKKRQTEALEDALIVKRRIKREVAAERARGPAPNAREAAVRVRVLDRRACVHFPASEDDVRAFVATLPPGSADGLDRIELSLGTKDQRAHIEDGRHFGCDPDPLTGRPGIEALPGVFVPPVLGRYWPDRSVIRLYAYVYAPTLPLRDVIEPYLCLKMLATLYHELAHHFDARMRTARGRWRADAPEKGEIYAELHEHAATKRYIVPFLRLRHAEGVGRLARWICDRGGIELPLDALADDPRITQKGGLRKFLFTVEAALDGLIRGTIEGKPDLEVRREFGENLHFAARHDAALAVIGNVLCDHPDDLESLVLHARALLAAGRPSEAGVAADRALLRAPDDVEAIEVRGAVHAAEGRWDDATTALSRALSLPSVDERRRLQLTLRRARALLELRRWTELEADLALLEGTRHARGAAELRTKMLTARG